MRKIPFSAFIYCLLAVCLLTSVLYGRRQQTELQRLRQNQGQLLQPTTVEFRTTSDGHHVAETQALNLKLSELRATNDSLLRLSRSLGIKNRRLMALAQTASESQTTITASVRDSIILRYLPGDTVVLHDTLRCLSFADPWLTLSGCIRADTFLGDIVSRDTLSFIVHRVPRRFLFFRYGCKAVRLEAVSHNPHTRLTHARYVRLTE